MRTKRSLFWGKRDSFMLLAKLWKIYYWSFKKNFLARSSLWDHLFLSSIPFPTKCMCSVVSDSCNNFHFWEQIVPVFEYIAGGKEVWNKFLTMRTSFYAFAYTTYNTFSWRKFFKILIANINSYCSRMAFGIFWPCFHLEGKTGWDISWVCTIPNRFQIC